MKGKTLQNCWLSLCSLQDSRTPLIVFCNLLPDWSVTFKKGRTDNRVFLNCQKLFNICHGEWLSGLGRVIQIERSPAQTPLGGWLGFGTQPCYEASGNGQVTIAFIQWRTSGDRGCHVIKWPSVSGGTQIEKNGLYSTTPKSISSKSILCHPGVSASSKNIDEVFRVIVFLRQSTVKKFLTSQKFCVNPCWVPSKSYWSLSYWMKTSQDGCMRL